MTYCVEPPCSGRVSIHAADSTPGSARTFCSDAIEELVALLRRRVLRLRNVDRGGQHVAGIESRIDGAQAAQAPHQQAGADQQHQRERHLRHDEQIADAAVAARGIAAAGPVLSASFASRPVSCHAGTNAASEPGGQRDRPR